MRVAIIHNTDAGDSDHTTDDLVERLRAVCDETQVCGTKREDIVNALQSAPDLLVVAGGDGTVGKTITTLFAMPTEPRVPLLVLPLGTANNLARSLHIDAGVDALMRDIHQLESVKFDVGRIEAVWGSELFVESVGIGPLGILLESERSRLIRIARAIREKARSKDSRFGKRIEDFAREVERADARPLHVIADGEDLSGDYIAVEAMNIRTVGPLIPFAPDADFGDGMLDLLLVSEDDRLALIDHVMSAGGESAEEAPTPPGIRRRVREVQMSWPEAGGHIDDQAWPDRENWADGGVRVSIAGSIEARRPR
ncbi:MAG: diacylglycerol/lipid kinase family protein [Gemmatimonas sp.]